MRRKVILYIAMSLDGYIADSTGGIGWLGGTEPDYTGDYGYQAFLQQIDTVIMGWRTYHQVVTELSDEWVYAGRQTYVLTHRALPEKPGIRFVNMPTAQLVRELREQDGGHIWICGGAEMVRQFLADDLIDEFRISVMPCLLGKGLRLFTKGTMIRLKLVSAKQENGVLNCIYQRRQD